MSGIVLLTPDDSFEERVREAIGARADEAVIRAPVRLLVMDAARATDTLLTDVATNPDVVVVGPRLPIDDSLRVAEALDERVPATSVVLAAQPDEGLFERALRAGVRDLVAPDADEADLRAAIEKAEQSATRRRAAQAELDAARSQQGRVTVVSSSKGGSGKTTVATNLAVELARRDGDTVLVDLDVQFGDAGSALQLLPEHTIADAVGSNHLDATGLKVLLTTHDSGLYVLAAPRDPVEAERVSADKAAEIIRLLAADFQHVVVDTDPGLSEHSLAALDAASDIVLICGMDVPSVNGFRKTLIALDQAGYTHQARHIVLNRADARVGLDTDDIARTLGVDINVELPSSRSVPLSVNQGVPIITAEPRAPVSAALRELADRFASTSTPRSESGESLLGKWRRKR